MDVYTRQSHDGEICQLCHKVLSDHDDMLVVLPYECIGGATLMCIMCAAIMVDKVDEAFAKLNNKQE